MSRKNDARRDLSTDAGAWWDAVHIQDAFRELSESSFNVWIILHTLNRTDLGCGIKKLGPRLNMNSTRLSRVLRKLVEVGYVAIDRGPSNFHPIKISLIKRASVKPSSHFVLVGAGRGRTKLTEDEEDAKVARFGTATQKAVQLATPANERRKQKRSSALRHHEDFIAAKRGRRQAAAELRAQAVETPQGPIAGDKKRKPDEP